ncbi:MAG: Fe-S cluster assembly protein SufD [Maricaulaceae bacterium]
MGAMLTDPTPAEAALLALIGEPDAPARAQAAQAFRAAGLPHRRVEAWKWTDLRRTLKTSLERAARPAERLTAGAPILDNADALGWTNGVRNQTQLSAALSLSLEPSPALDDRVMERPAAALAVALAEERVSLSVEAGAEARLTLRHAAHGPGVSAEHLALHLAAGARLTLVEVYDGASAGAFANTLVELTLEPGARLDRVVVLDDADGVRAATTLARVAQDAAFTQTVITGGAQLSRFETVVDVNGEGALVSLDGAYALGSGRHADLTTHVRHAAPHAQTQELFKGVVAKGGRAVFQGKILVDSIAQKTDARMGHHALLLEEGAEVDAKPELEIYADDVACAHGNTAGALDEDALFYLRQRGVPAAEARALLTRAFLAEALERIADEPLREAMTDRLIQALEALV